MANVLNLISRQLPHSIPYQMFSGKACAALGSIAALAILMLGTHSYQQTENVRFQRVVDYLIMNPIQRVISSRLVNSIGYEIYYFKFKISEYCGDLKERVSRKWNDVHAQLGTISPFGQREPKGSFSETISSEGTTYTLSSFIGRAEYVNPEKGGRIYQTVVYFGRFPFLT